MAAPCRMNGTGSSWETIENQLFFQQLGNLKKGIVEENWGHVAESFEAYSSERVTELLSNLTDDEFINLLFGIRESASPNSYQAFNILLSQEERVRSLTEEQSDRMTLTFDERQCEAGEQRIKERIGFFIHKFGNQVSKQRLTALLEMPIIKEENWLSNLIQDHLKRKPE